MQLSIKTPPELTRPVLEKCTVFGEDQPSCFVTDCAWQCVKWMDMPHGPFHPLPVVEKYYRALGRDNELLPSPKRKQDEIVQRITDEDRAKRAKEATKRLAEFHARLKKQPVPKHLHLKISQGMADLPQRIKAKAEWLRITPNALVMACLRDCLAAMDDPRKALIPPPIAVEFWAVSHAKLRPKPKGAAGTMVLETYETILRGRSGPILDTIIRLALAEQWDATLEKILREADVISEDREMKSRIGSLRR